MANPNTDSTVIIFQAHWQPDNNTRWFFGYVGSQRTEFVYGPYDSRAEAAAWFNLHDVELTKKPWLQSSCRSYRGKMPDTALLKLTGAFQGDMAT